MVSTKRGVIGWWWYLCWPNPLTVYCAGGSAGLRLGVDAGAGTIIVHAEKQHGIRRRQRLAPKVLDVHEDHSVRAHAEYDA